VTAAYLLDAAARVMCPHGGTLTTTPRVSRVTLGGRAPLLLDDPNVVGGCGASSPCARVQWSAPATRVTIEGGKPLLSTSVGTCVGGAGPQGLAVVTGYQTRVTAQ
jgi:hypothetical protein